MSIIYFYALKFTFNSSVRIYGIRSVKYDSIKGQVLYIQTLTAQVEAPSLETAKFSLYFSGSCIRFNPKLSHIFPPEFLVVFNRFQCKQDAPWSVKSLGRWKYATLGTVHYLYLGLVPKRYGLGNQVFD